MFSIVNTTFEYGPNTVQIEMGEIARQASASVKLDMDGTVILCAVVGKKTMRPGQAFFPLTVNYQEKTYAAGKIPGGFFRREARPSESETLIARLVDRPIRPLFPEGFMNDVQVVITVMSLNPEVSTDIAAMLAASAALAASGLPFSGPIAAARVGYINNEYVLNPALSQMEESQLDLVVAGTDNAVLMVESEADELAEDVMLGAVVYGHKQMAVAIDAIKEFAEAVGTEPWDWKADEKDAELSEKVKGLAEDKITAAYQIADKMERYGALGAVAEEVVAAVNPDPEAENAYALDDIKGEIKSLEKNIVRSRVIKGEPRIDGRDSTTVRDIDVQVGVLPRTHGSALFTRGETQAIVVTTLGSARDMQIIDSLTGEYKEHFMLHYNFPPYCVGETGMMGSPKRREIGHGNLARRGIRAVMPAYEDFPYTIRVVSEITESNGSSSMASVCGCSLSMMDAGVPLKAPVAGIAMGLVKEGDDFAVLTDILGDEDHLGDMDFKVAGTRNGVSTLQMDIKIDGISPEIMQQALEQAHAARIHILDQMDAVIAESRTEVSQHAPKMLSMTIHKDKIRDVIGKGGETIRGITEETGATVDINDDGELTITAVSGEAAEAAKAIIEGIVEDPEVGKMYTGPVVKILENIGALVEILPKKSGLVHKSQVSDEFIDDVAKFLKEGDVVTVKLLGIDRGKYRLTMKGIDQPNIDSLPQAGATTDSESDDSVGNS